MHVRISTSALVIVIAAISPIGRTAIVHAQIGAPHQLDGPRHYEGPPVSLDALIAEARAQNPDLLALRAEAAVVRQRPGQERALNPPMVEVTAWQWPIDTLNPANTNMYMFMLGQDLPGRGKRDLRAAVAQKEAAIADADVDIRTRDLVNQIEQAYTSLYIARKAIDVHLENVSVLRQMADAAEVKYATSRISQQDVIKPVTELSKLHNDVLMLDEQANLAAARLNVLIDRPADTPIGPLVDPLEQTLLPDMTGVQQLALQHHPALVKARLDTDRAQAALNLARQDYKPDFNVQGGYLLMPHQTDALLARVGITWPLAPWSRGKIDAHVAEQSAAVDAARSREHALESRLRLAVAEAYVRAQSAQQRAALIRTTILPQSQQIFDVSRVAYQSDRTDFQSVLDSQRELLDTQLDYYRALTEFEQAIADLKRAVGGDLPPGTTQAVVTTGGN